MSIKRFNALPQRHQEIIKKSIFDFKEKYNRDPSDKELKKVMDSVVEKIPYSKEERVADLKRKAAIAAAGAGEGLLSIVDLPFDLADLGITGAQYLGSKIAPKTIPEPQGIENYVSPHIAKKARKALDTATNQYTSPTTGGEELLNLGADVAGGITGFGGIGKGIRSLPKLPKALRKFTQALDRTEKFMAEAGSWNKTNVGASYGGAYAGHYAMTPDEENLNAQPSAIKALGAGIAGSVLGSKVPGAIQKSVTQPVQTLKGITEAPKDALASTLSSYYKFDPELYNKYKNIGNMISHYTDNVRGYKAMENRRHGITTSDIMSKADEQLNKNLAQNLGIGDISDISTHPDYDKILTGAMKAKKAVDTEYLEKAAGAEQYLKRLKDDEALVDISPVLKTFEEENPAILKSASPAKEKYLKTAPGEIYKELEKAEKFYKGYEPQKDLGRSSNKLMDREFPFLEIEKPLEKRQTEIAHLKLVLDEIKTKLDDPKISRKEQSELIKAKKEMDNIVDNRLNFYAEQGDQSASEALKNLKEANKLYYDAHNKKILKIKKPGQENAWDFVETEGTVLTANKLLNSSSKREAFNSVLSSADPSNFKTLKKGLSETERQSLAKDIISSISLNNKNEFVPAQVSKWYNKMNDPTRKAFLDFSFTKDVDKNNFKKAVEFIAENQNKYAKWANPSKTSHNLDFMDLLKKPEELVKQVVKAIGPGATIGAKLDPVIGSAMFITQLAGSRAMAKLLTDPEFLARMNSVTLAKNARQGEKRLIKLVKVMAPKITQRTISGTKALTEEEEDSED